MREKQELLRGVNAFAANMFTLLIEWKHELDAVENTERRTAKGKKIIATFKQCARCLTLPSTYAGRRDNHALSRRTGTVFMYRTRKRRLKESHTPVYW